MSAAQDLLRGLGACSEAVTWVGDRTLADAWAECPRGDWMLWLVARVGVDRRIVVAAACAVARTALVHVPAGEDRPRRAIETAERWTRGEATIAEVRTAAAAAAAAYSAAAAAYSAAAAAAAAAYSAAAADAAYSAAAAVDATAYAAAAARATALRESADLVRSTIPWSVVETAIEVAS